MALSDLFPPLKISIDRIGLVTEIDGSSHPGFSCSITSPAPATALTVGTPVTVSGTLFGSVVLLQVKLGSMVLGSASIVGNTWSYTYTPQVGDIGARTINATATHTSGAQASATGVAVTVTSSATPLTLITSTTPKLWLDSELGAGVNTWTDQSTSHFDATEATHPPTLTTLGTVPCYTGNGTNQLFTATGLTLTSGNWYWMIARQISWSASYGSFCGGSAAAAHTFLQDGGGASPAVSIFNTGVVDQNPTAMTVGSWFRVMFKFSNSAGDYLQVGASGNKVSGNPGALTGTGWNLFARANANFGNVAIANVVCCPAEPTGPEKTALDAWYAAKSFGGVVGF